MTAYEQAQLWSTIRMLCRDAMEEADKQQNLKLVNSLLVLALARAEQLRIKLEHSDGN